MSYLLSAHGISMCLPDGSPLFHDFTFSLGREKVGLIGKNGIGKTTLLRLANKEIEPKSGQILLNGKISYLPQKINDFSLDTVSKILNVDDKLTALGNADAGCATLKDLELIGDDWDLKQQIEAILHSLHLEYLKLDSLGSQLSGGELMRVLFARVLLEKPVLILMDEPTNNLDFESKNLFFEVLKASKAGMLIVSHDRELLNQMDRILEMSNLGLRPYGGNFDFYLAQRKIEDEAAIMKIQSAEELLKKQTQLEQKTKEKQEKRNIRGGKNTYKLGVSRLQLGGMLEKAQNTTAKLKEVHEDRVQEAKENLNAAQGNIREQYAIQIDVEKSKIPASKEMILCKNVNFKYKNDSEFLWKNPLNIEIIGNKRIAIAGKNGSGKTTLIKLITGEITPTIGEVKLGSKRLAVLDQKCSLLNEELSILENMQKFAPVDMKIHELRIRAGRFLFYNDAVFKKVKDLSGGECLRVALACLLATSNAPDILILDEPTNNLDLNSIEILTNSLNQYTGTLLVISHDQYFLNDIKIEKTLYLERNLNAK